VHLDAGDGDGLQGVEEGEGRMGEGAGIEEEPVEAAPGRPDPVEEDALVVRLVRLDRGAELGGALGEPCVDVGERLGPVNRGLACAEELQIGAGEDEDPPRAARLLQASSAISFGAAVRIR
jgi:hypothetical protein